MQPIEMAYTRSGGGEAVLICLHSLSAASGTFAGLAHALEDDADVVCLDLRGFGGSHRPTHEYAVDLWIDDAVKLLAEVAPTSPPVSTRRAPSTGGTGTYGSSSPTSTASS